MKKLIGLLLVVALLCAFAVPAMAADAVTVTVSGAAAKQGDTVTLDVSIANNPGILSGKVALSYDKAALELTALTLVKFQGAANPATAQANHFSATPMTGDGVLFTATFKVLAATGDHTVSATVSGMRTEDGAQVEASAVAGTVKIDCQHSWGEWKETGAADCTNKGEKTRTCSICGEIEKQDVAAAGHDFSKMEKDKDYHWSVCSVCGETGEKVAHTYTNDGKCVCGQEKPADLDDVPGTGDVTYVYVTIALALVAMLGVVCLTWKRILVK